MQELSRLRVRLRSLLGTKDTGATFPFVRDAATYESKPQPQILRSIP